MSTSDGCPYFANELLEKVMMFAYGVETVDASWRSGRLIPPKNKDTFKQLEAFTRASRRLRHVALRVWFSVFFARSAADLQLDEDSGVIAQYGLHLGVK